MLERISAAEFREWQIYEGIEPFGEMGDYQRAMMISVALAGGKDLIEFIPETMRGTSSSAQDPESMKALMMMLKEQQDAYLARKGQSEVVQKPI